MWLYSAVEDYVVFKLDIDAPFVEIALVQQIMVGPALNPKP